MPNSILEQYSQQRVVGGAPISLHSANNLGQDIRSKRTYIREIAGKKWVDATLAEWPVDDHRLFVGNLSKDVTDEILAQHFAHYPSFAKARVVRDKYNYNPLLTKGYGFISFLDVTDYTRALKEMEGTYIINRPCRLSKSTWDERNASVKKSIKVKTCKYVEVSSIIGKYNEGHNGTQTQKKDSFWWYTKLRN